MALGLLAALIPVGTASASGGGGCGRDVTNESGTEIEILEYCFTPTVLFAEPGDTVTWTNLDPTFHNVGGANMAWGSFERIRTDRSVSYSFSAPGVYSYVCSVHIGMVGTVVVGDPQPHGASTTGTVRRIKHARAVSTDPLPAPEESEGAALWLGMAALAGLGCAFVVARMVRRRLRA
jgi:plastocyanin